MPRMPATETGGYVATCDALPHAVYLATKLIEKVGNNMRDGYSYVTAWPDLVKQFA